MFIQRPGDKWYTQCQADGQNEAHDASCHGMLSLELQRELNTPTLWGTEPRYPVMPQQHCDRTIATALTPSFRAIAGILTEPLFYSSPTVRRAYWLEVHWTHKGRIKDRSVCLMVNSKGSNKGRYSKKSREKPSAHRMVRHSSWRHEGQEPVGRILSCKRSVRTKGLKKSLHTLGSRKWEKGQ